MVSGLINPIKFNVKGPVKTCTITDNSTSVGSLTEVLPSSKPASPQITITLTNTGTPNIPTISGDPIHSWKIATNFIFGVSNGNGSSARTLNWEIYKDDILISPTGSGSIPASNKGCLNYKKLNGANAVVNGNVITAFLWCSESDSDLTLTKYALETKISSPLIYNDTKRLLANTNYTITRNSLSNFTAYYTNQGMYLKKATNGNASMGGGQYSQASPITVSYDFDREVADYGLIYTNLQTSTAEVLNVHATNNHYDVTGSITSISWQETNVRY